MMIEAHHSQLAAISFSATGLRVATASEKGTVIRIFNVANGDKIYELRRGLKRLATIYSMSWSPCGHYLACSSNTETVHVFRMEDQNQGAGHGVISGFASRSYVHSSR